MKEKIGVIDSGLGGLTVAKEVIKNFPSEEVIYFGDTGRCPYGNRNKEEIKKFVWEMIDYLLSKNIKALIVACNTATALMIDEIREKLEIPVFGVIEPGAKEAILRSKNKKIAVIATTRTIETGVYKNTLQSMDNVEVFSKDCPLFVPMIEEGTKTKDEMLEIVEKSLQSLKEKNMDTLILGCTHYPLIKDEIKQVLGEHIELVDSTKQIVKELRKTIAISKSSENPIHEFYVSGDVESFKEKAEKWLQFEINVKQIQFEKNHSVK